MTNVNMKLIQKQEWSNGNVINAPRPFKPTKCYTNTKLMFIRIDQLNDPQGQTGRTIVLNLDRGHLPECWYRAFYPLYLRMNKREIMLKSMNRKVFMWIFCISILLFSVCSSLQNRTNQARWERWRKSETSFISSVAGR